VSQITFPCKVGINNPYDLLRARLMEREEACIAHVMANGSTLYECHACPDGTLAIEDDIPLVEGDVIICCHTQQVISRYGEDFVSFFPVVTAHPVRVSYQHVNDEAYSLIVEITD